MKVFRYWAKQEHHHDDGHGRRLDLVAWGGSNVDDAEADARARTRMARWRELLRDGVKALLESAAASGYGYGEADVMREELIEGEPVESGFGWAITRTRSGTEVLNATQLAILDIDRRGRGFLAWLRSLFKPGRQLDPGQITHIIAWVENNPGAGLRLYRTPAGLRAILTHRRFDPASPEIEAIMHALLVDRLYMRLCKRQRCFRARLTPKPWRIDCHMGHWRPLAAGEFRSDADRRWLDEYTKRSRGHAACAWIADYGNATPADADIAALIALHDARSGALSRLPLA
jgi:hypothetical protein